LKNKLKLEIIEQGMRTKQIRHSSIFVYL